MSTVFVTGASGFLGLHIVDQLLLEGYDVLAAVRSPAKEGAVREVLKAHPKGTLSFAYVPDIGVEDAYDEVFKTHHEITHVIHTASPVVFNPEDPVKDVVEPAVKGTTNILKATKTYGPQVKKMVVTSSVVTILNRDFPYTPGTVINEKTWVAVTLEDAKKGGPIAYRVSKVFAEKALWEFVAKEKPSYEVTTVLPPFIFGPVLGDVKTAGDLNLSSGLLFNILIGEYPQSFTAGVVDVRDTARAHVTAVGKSDTDGKRLLIQGGSFVAKQAVEFVNEAGLKGFIAPDSSVDADAILSAAQYTIDDSASRKLLGFVPKSPKDIIVESAKDFLDRKLIR
jgi:nucleoside-diphosphate-sugar epimerase